MTRPALQQDWNATPTTPSLFNGLRTKASRVITSTSLILGISAFSSASLLKKQFHGSPSGKSPHHQLPTSSGGPGTGSDTNHLPSPQPGSKDQPKDPHTKRKHPKTPRRKQLTPPLGRWFGRALTASFGGEATKITARASYGSSLEGHTPSQPAL